MLKYESLNSRDFWICVNMFNRVYKKSSIEEQCKFHDIIRMRSIV